MAAKDLGPLDWRVPIVDGSGRPSPEFQRRWNTQRSNNALIGSVTLGSGVPTGTPSDGAEYVDISTAPFTVYLGSGGTWHQAGAMKFTDLLDGPFGYTGAALKLVQVNAGATGLIYAPVTITAAGQIGNVLDPVAAQDAATKHYVDALVAASGFPMTSYNGDLNLINPGLGKQSVVVAIAPATNRPVSVEGYVITWGNPLSANILFQIFIARTQQTIYTRQYVSGVWGAWTAFSGGMVGVEFLADASVVKLGGTSAQTQVFNVPITANRNFTASLTNADIGHKFRVLRSAACTGAFNVTVKSGSGATLATLSSPGDWADIEFDGTDWRATAPATSLSGAMDAAFSSTRGSILYRGAAAWAALGPGTVGQVLQTNGAGADPSWAASGGGGTGYGYELAPTKPVTANFTLQNAGTATMADGTFGIVLTSPASATPNIRFVKSNTAAPATPWALTARARTASPRSTANYERCLIVRNTASGKLLIFGLFQTGYLVQRWNSYTSFNAAVINSVAAYFTGDTPWMRIRNDGTSLYFGFSPDGESWCEDTTSELLSTFIGSVTEVGFGNFVNTAPSGFPQVDVFQSFKVA